MKLRVLSLLFGCYFLVPLVAFSQDKSEILKLEKGILVDKLILDNMKEHDYQILKNYNFDEYRNEKSIQKITIVRGPEIVLMPFQFLIDNNLSFNINLYKEKRGEVISNHTYTRTVRVDIGFGFLERKNSESGF